MKTVDGKCLCGAVQFKVGAFENMGMCHCGMCRRWCGGMPFAAGQGQVELQQSDSVRWWKSSQWGERGFCGECGSSLFWRAAGAPLWTIAVGALPDDPNMQCVLQIFCDEKPGFYDIAGDAERLTGPEFTAKTLAMLAQQFGDEFLQDALQKSRAHNGDAFADEVQRLISAHESGANK